MERYFLGNNTGYGFRSYYEQELKKIKTVILLKGGPGTGKSSLLRKLAQKAHDKGMDYEEWYCSGDPTSLDGIYIKDVDVAVTDATSPHATGADLPVMRDIIFDLAQGLDKRILDANVDIIKHILNDKKRYFNRAYQHLKCALCHYNNMIECERAELNERALNRFAAAFAQEISIGNDDDGSGIRRLFARAICPSGESAYYDCLRDKKIFKLKGGEYAVAAFINRVSEYTDSATVLLNPLEPLHAEGIIVGDTAVVGDAGQFGDKVSEEINLNIFAGRPDVDAIEEERNACVLSTAFAVEQLNKGRAAHLNAEKYFIAAMDFTNIDKQKDRIDKIVFGD